jgi:eukaryotic-like serine/threonine-protein kinase
VLGRYTLFDHIGRGGMADIYLASARAGLGASRRVVIKEVLAELSENARFAELLIAEAKLAARLSHANVVKVEDLGRHEDTLYIAMEYVEGFDLRELLRRCAKQRVALPIEFSLLIVIETLRGLDYAHRLRAEGGEPLQIVHRDVSPSNVLMSFEGEVKLCDFGIARANDAAEQLPEEAIRVLPRPVGALSSRMSVSVSGSASRRLDIDIQGKAGYMSPEHARGEALDARADVFAAGIILWELLAGRRLYKASEGGSQLEIARRAEVPPLPIRGDIPDEERLHAVVARALAPSRDDRYPAAAPMLRDLEEYAARARMLASPIRFGEWLREHFGGEIVAARHARERALKALELGPAATLRPIEPPPAATPTEFVALPLPDDSVSTPAKPRRQGRRAARPRPASPAITRANHDAAVAPPPRRAWPLLALRLLLIIAALAYALSRA